jgi:predicted  nucleic acid-binding Zn-ribbon protein
MLVSKEKYNDAVKALRQAEQDMEQKDVENSNLLAEVQNLKEQLNTRAGDQQSELEALRKENALLKEQATEKDKQISDLQTECNDSAGKLQTLQADLDKLSNLPAVAASKAVSQSDAPHIREDINDYMRNNSGDINACMNRLKEEGF